MFYCDNLTLSGYERDYDELWRNFESAYRQIVRDYPRLEEFLSHAEG